MYLAKHILKIVKILIPVGEVPFGSQITKKSGEKKYVVRDKITIYSEDGCAKPSNDLSASSGTRLLVANDPNYSFAIVAVPESLEVLWEISDDSLIEFLSQRESHQ